MVRRRIVVQGRWSRYPPPSVGKNCFHGSSQGKETTCANESEHAYWALFSPAEWRIGRGELTPIGAVSKVGRGDKLPAAADCQLAETAPGHRGEELQTDSVREVWILDGIWRSSILALRDSDDMEGINAFLPGL